MTKADRSRKIDSYGRAHEELAKAIQGFPREMWQWKPAADRWSVHEIIVHLADSEANGYVRARRFLAEPGKEVMAYEQDDWARHLNYHEQNPDEAVELFRLLRSTTWKLIQDAPEEVWSRTVGHPEYGSVTFDQWLDTYEAHVPGHIRQMQANYEAWQKQQGV